MGTRADFYLGRDPATMTYLGSIAWDGYPRGIMVNPRRPDGPRVLLATTEGEYLAAVGALLAQCDDASIPSRDGWPWPWDDSKTTDYAYAFDGDRVYAAVFGDGWFEPTRDGRPFDFSDEDEDRELFEKLKPVVFPNMDGIKRATLGKRSGVIVLGGEPPTET